MYKKLGFIFAFLAVIGLVLFLVGGLYKYNGYNYGALNNQLGAIDFGRWVNKIELLGPNINLNDPTFDEFEDLGVNFRPLFAHIQEIYHPVVIHYKLFLAGVVSFPISTVISLACFYANKVKNEESEETTNSIKSTRSKDPKVLELQKQIEEINEKISDIRTKK